VNEGIRKRLQIIFSVSKRRAEEEIRERLVEMGLTEDLAKNAAEKIAQDKNSIKSLVPREESSELRAAVYTGLAYIMGVFFPVILYFLTSTIYIALPLSVIFAGLTLAIVSTIISIISGISVRKKVAEMIILDLGAAGLSYLVASLMNLLFGAAFT